MNQCTLIGNLTKDPELRSTPNGVSVCTFSIGVSRRFANQNGERETDFFNIVIWKKTAENAAKYLRKGSQCAIIGTIQNRSYEAKDGNKRYITEIIAEQVQFLNSKEKRNESTEILGQDSGMIEVNEDMPF